MKQIVIVLAGAAAICAAGAAQAPQAGVKFSETRSQLEKWVETRQLVSKTRSDWQADKETLDQSIALLKRELKGVEELMTKLSTNSAQADKERAQTEASIKAANDALEPAGKFAADFEGQIRALVPKLPQPLQEILKPTLAKFPAEAANTKMKATERVQAVVAALNEIDKFNGAVTIFSEKRKNASGAEVAVETVYVGLGGAYFVNEAGDFAGTGSPGAAGWEWTPRPEIAATVREAIKIYRNEHPARFLALPASVK